MNDHLNTEVLTTWLGICTILIIEPLEHQAIRACKIIDDFEMYPFIYS